MGVALPTLPVCQPAVLPDVAKRSLMAKLTPVDHHGPRSWEGNSEWNMVFVLKVLRDLRASHGYSVT